MDRICQYSTIIFAGNVSVLLLVALSTDYWEYRSFSVDRINRTMHTMPRRLRSSISIYRPSSTKTHFAVQFVDGHQAALRPLNGPLPALLTPTHVYAEPPAVLYKYKVTERVEVTTKVNVSGVRERDTSAAEIRTVAAADIIVLYTQYGNIFRDCDDLGGGLRRLLGLTNFSASRCASFLTGAARGTAYIQTEIPAVVHLERITVLVALVCVVSSVLSVVSGAHGLIHDLSSYKIGASSTALVSAMTLTVVIALFHGKCHLLRRRELLKDVHLELKHLINDGRSFQFGWSFVLAWICVVLCFVHSWVWLLKAQNSETQKNRRLSHANAKLLQAFREFDQNIQDDQDGLL